MRRSAAHTRFRSDLAFLDMLFNMVLAFAFLFVIAVLLIRPPTTVKANVEMKAEFMITMTWPDDSIDDVDLWLLLPTGAKVGYSNKDFENAALDRDDRGAHGDTMWKDSDMAEKILIKRNEEIITIRAIVPGRYVIAGHLFGVYDHVDGFKGGSAPPYEVQLKVLKLNPKVETIATSKITLEQLTQQSAFVAFTLQQDGTVTDIEQNPADVIVNVPGGTP